MQDSSPALGSDEVRRYAPIKVWLGDDKEWITVPQPPAFEDGTIWHYTSAGGLNGILKGNLLWASSATMLNDSSEIEYGIQRIKAGLDVFKASPGSYSKAIVNHISDIIDAACNDLLQNDVFVLCASKSRDELSQWRGYAEGSGYAIGLRVQNSIDDPLRISAIDKPPHAYGVDRVWPRWMSVLYDPAAQDLLVAELIEMLCKYASYSAGDDEGEERRLDHSAGFVSTIAVCLKNPGFAVEEELDSLSSQIRIGQT